MDVIPEEVEAIKATERGNHHSTPVYLLGTLDVKNALTSVAWTNVLEAMERDFHVPPYLLRIMESYLKNCYLMYDTSEGPKRRELTAGAAQGSLLGTDIWNIPYDNLIRIELPEGTFLVGYADDMGVIIIGCDVETAQMRLNQVMRRVTRWMEAHGLELAAAKTEIVFVTKRCIPTMHPMEVEDVMV